MADGKMKISELSQALSLSDDAAFPYTQEQGGEMTTFKAFITQIGAKIAEGLTFSNLRTSNKQIVNAINEVKGTELSGTLLAGSTSLTLNDNSILTTSTVDIYADVYGVSPTAVTVAAGSITMTFSVQAQDVGIKVVVK